MSSVSGLGAGLDLGARFPDFALSDHAGNERRLSDLVGGDPTVLQFYRGWWCPKEQEFFRRMVRFQDAVEVAYARMISVSVDAPLVSFALRAGLGARWTFLSDEDRSVQRELLRDDPFGRLFPARVLRVAEGVLGAAPLPVGPTIERYGSASPWPGDRFVGQRR